MQCGLRRGRELERDVAQDNSHRLIQWRYTIARAFLSDAGLWVLDEPTAHLDADTEAQIIVALRNATRGRTVIMATHSTALARSADVLLGLTDGTVHAVREAMGV